jgi:hypothetical protein
MPSRLLPPLFAAVSLLIAPALVAGMMLVQAEPGTRLRERVPGPAPRL